jgi:hypothetical protein
MRKITDLKPNEVIHCPTQEGWDKIIALNLNNTLRSWHWDKYTSESVYDPNWDNGHGGYSPVEWYETNGYTIYPASDFLEPDFEWGEEIEASIDNADWHKKIFVALNPKSEECKFVTVTEKGRAGFYKYARKIQQVKPIPEYTMEQLMDRVGHEFKIKK